MLEQPSEELYCKGLEFAVSSRSCATFKLNNFV